MRRERALKRGCFVTIRRHPVVATGAMVVGTAEDGTPVAFLERSQSFSLFYANNELIISSIM
ncbi:hypothetical protein COLO4_30272 [Corchorus olitorius]|uniref:Uncharacterized protein n=1 Tax=Corchorus olitorius TaxID=93759 RepID=A0A1R3H9C8_9ROSI|nr:hypothetical protein COLO4_30272 [Corchorus olitorius]